MKELKRLTFVLIAMVAFCQVALAQEQKKPLSPKDTAQGNIDGVKVVINYSSPSVRGRKIMGELVPYNQLWRTGANQATTIEFDKAVQIEGKELPAGKYAIFTIPGENEWTIVFNKKLSQHGTSEYTEAEDALRVKVKPTKTKQFEESFKFEVEKNQVILKWENTQAAFNVKKA